MVRCGCIPAVIGSALIVNLLMLIYIARLQPSASYNKASCLPNNGQWHTEQGRVTIIIRNIDRVENSIVETMTNALSNILGTRGIILSDAPSKPPIFLPQNLHELVSMTTLKPSLGQPYYLSDPAYFLQTEYVVIVPDGTRLVSPDVIEKSIKHLNSGRHQVVVVPVNFAGVKKNRNDEEDVPCNVVEVSLMQKTVIFKKPLKSNAECNYLSNSPLVVTTKAAILNMTWPFVQPFPHTFFIEVAMRNMSVHICDDVILLRDNMFWYSNLELAEENAFYEFAGIKKG